MATHLFTWKPKHYPELYDDYQKWVDGSLKTINWSAGIFKDIPKDARVFLMRQGTEPGIIAAGRTTSKNKPRPHRDGTPGKLENSNDIELLDFSHPDNVLVSLAELLKIENKRNGLWLYGSPGITIPAHAAEQLETAWRKAADKAGVRNPSADFPNELPPGTHPEGLKTQVIVNAYERNPKARRDCIDYHKPICQVCALDFFKRYGEIGKGFIHVHHLKPLAEIGKEYQVNPIDDLRPVCPNCHAMLHRGRGATPLSIEELKSMLRD